MRALIVLDGSGSKVLGAWLVVDNKLQVAFRGSSLQFTNANAIANSKKPDQPWDEWFVDLSHRTPVSFWWESKTVPDNASAQDVLDAEVKRQFS